MYLHAPSFLHTDMTQVVEILSHVRQEPIYFTYHEINLVKQGKVNPRTLRVKT